MNPVPRRYAREYLERAPSLSVLVFLNAVLVVVGLRFYVDRGLADVSTFLWPLFADSPTATFLATLSFATLLGNAGRPLEAARQTLPLAYLHTLAFVWLVKYGLWTAVAIHLGFGAYFPDPFGYFAVVVSHLGFVVEAFLVAHYARTTPGALATAFGLSLLNDLLDYGFVIGLAASYHPPLRYDPGVALAAATVGLSALAVVLAAASIPRLGVESDG